MPLSENRFGRLLEVGISSIESAFAHGYIKSTKYDSVRVPAPPSVIEKATIFFMPSIEHVTRADSMCSIGTTQNSSIPYQERRAPSFQARNSSVKQSVPSVLVDLQ